MAPAHSFRGHQWTYNPVQGMKVSRMACLSGSHLCSDSHRLISSHPAASNDSPIPVDGHGCGDRSPELQLPLPRCRLVPLALLLLSPSSLSLLSFVLPSSVWIPIFLLSSQGFLPVFTWPSVRTDASSDLLDASVERGVPHFHLPFHHLVHPHQWMY